MKTESFKNSVMFSKHLIKNVLSQGSIVVDATIGNGHDTLFMKKLVGYSGKVYGFDIQDIAIENTKERLIQNKLFENVFLIKDSHEKIDKYIEENVDLVMFNLGYLPGGDHKIKTHPLSTINAIKSSITKLNKYGIVIIVAYLSHEGAKLEINKINSFLESLDQKIHNVFKLQFINQINEPPILYCIEKK